MYFKGRKNHLELHLYWREVEFPWSGPVWQAADKAELCWQWVVCASCDPSALCVSGDLPSCWSVLGEGRCNARQNQNWICTLETGSSVFCFALRAPQQTGEWVYQTGVDGASPSPRWHCDLPMGSSWEIWSRAKWFSLCSLDLLLHGGPSKGKIEVRTRKAQLDQFFTSSRKQCEVGTL